jgi:D-3-phosphoglycerate dehydrogenase
MRCARRTSANVERDNYERYFGIAFDHINQFADGTLSDVVNPEALVSARL